MPLFTAVATWKEKMMRVKTLVVLITFLGGGALIAHASEPAHQAAAAKHASEPVHTASANKDWPAVVKKESPAPRVKSHEPAKHGSAPAVKIKRSHDKHHDSDAPHWGYSGAGGPDHWGDLKSEFAQCKLGMHQTPIDIDETYPAQLPGLKFGYDAEPLAVGNNGHTVQVDLTPGNTLRVGGAKYQLAQYHFHAPSEHTVKGKAYDMELHLVHKNAKNQLAVIGVLIKKGQHNAVLDRIWNVMPMQAGKKVEKPEMSINPEALLPAGRGYYHYVGSLTTPPCSEGVRWFVLREPIEASPEQIAEFAGLFHGHTARPVQTVNGRFVLSSE
jgi:carbonic anhydrase